MIKKAPIVFKPFFKTVLWGGNKICAYKKIPQTGDNIGESWEISTLPGFETEISEGVYKGLNLNDLIDKFGENLLGKKVVKKYGLKFPLLIKFIDARDNLSVQVHPDDNMAMRRHGTLGKTEMWYVIQSDKDARIYVGLNTVMTPQEYEERVKNGTFAETLLSHESNPGDVFFLPGGRVHSIGAGNLLAEIQESCDITYRIYDFERKDSNGNLRELHIEQAKEAIDFNIHNNYKIPHTKQTEESVELVTCEHFKTHRLLINGEKELLIDDSSFVVLICIEGDVSVSAKDGEIKLTAGHTALIPANAGKINIKGQATILSASI